MKKIKLLDCTLRDGGYINDWDFGKESIIDITQKLENSNVDILEIGFLRPESYDENKALFNNIEQFKSIVKRKKPNIQYALMAEVSNPFPLDKLPERTPDGPDIIRVIVWKRMLKEGLEYCREIVKKGYKLCVQPARANQYSDEEFIDMLKMYDELNPLAVYVVDSWGTMYKDELLHYLDLANKHLSPNVAVGYHGHNNMMQAFEVACAFCEFDMDRELFIDASVYGIGRGAGNLNIELFAKWMNEKYNTNYDLNKFIYVFDKYIKQIFDKTKWGYSIPYYITAKYNANPNFVEYFVENHIANDLMEEAIKLISPEDRIIYTEKKAENAVHLANKEKWQKRVVVVVSANRAEALEGYLDASAQDFWNLGIDLVIFDSSDNDNTKKISQEYGKKYENVKYDKWTGIYDGISIDNKVIDAYKKYSKGYDYVLVTREGTPLNIKSVISGIEKYIVEGYDLIVLDAKARDWKYKGCKVYDDIKELFLDQAHQMTVLGSTILKSEHIDKIIEENPIDIEKNYAIWQPIAIFNYFAYRKIKAYSWVGHLWHPNSKAKPSSHWHKKTLWQWGERWYKAISSLPHVYDKHKSEVMKFELIDCQPFSTTFLLKVKKIGGLSLFEVFKYKKYIPYVTNTPLWQIYAISLMPYYFSKIIHRLFSVQRKYDSRFSINQKSHYKIDFSKQTNCFELTKDIKSNLIYEEDNIPKKPFITVFIPTYKRTNLLKEALDSVVNQKDVDFDWEILIVDNEPYDGFPNKTEKLIKSYKINKIRYYRNNENLRVGDNFNRGIYLAKAPWVMMLHDDDMLFSKTLKNMKDDINFFSQKKGKPLGAIATSSQVFTYNSDYPKAHLDFIKEVNKFWSDAKSLKKFYKLTNNNILFTSHIGGSVPSCGATYNREAMLNVGGFNDDFGISADLVLYYCIEKEYSVYQTLDPYGFYRWGQNTMSKKESTYKTIKDNNDFREYIFSKNIFTKIWGFFFRSVMYHSFTARSLEMRKTISDHYVEYKDYADIYNKKPNKIAYWIWRKIFFRAYQYHKKIETRKNKHEYKRHLKKIGVK